MNIVPPRSARNGPVTYMPVYHTGTSFVPEFHTGTYQYTLYPFIFFLFLTVYSCFAFTKYTGTSTFTRRFRALLSPEER
jgi:hypothetical protein